MWSSLSPPLMALLVDLKVGEGGEGRRVPEHRERPEVPVEGSPSAQLVQGYYVGGGVSVWCDLDELARHPPGGQSDRFHGRSNHWGTSLPL